MGSVQRLATVVIIGLVALSTVLFLYLGDESSRIDAKAELHQEAAVERATSNFITLCLQCHGPAGEGYTEPGVSGTGRIGAPLGGINTSLNQEGVNASGTPYPGGVEARAGIIHTTIYNGLLDNEGNYRMPAFGGASGSLTDSQINELVTMIQHVDWNVVYNHAIEQSGGYPTPPPAAAPATDAGATDAATSVEPGGSTLVIESHDIAFQPTTLEIPANTDITIELPNHGAAPHNFTIDELEISVDLAPGATESVVINAPPGEYEFYCNVPGHKEAGMHGILVVTEGYELPTAAADSGDAPAATAGTTDESGAGAASESFTVVSHDISFDPTELTIPANTDVTLLLPNEGAAPHNFTIDELEISVDQAPGAKESVVINAPPGEYEFYCNVPGHRESGMHGTLVVTEDYESPAAAADSGDAPAASPETTDEAGDGSASESFEVVSHDILFDPTELTIPANSDVTLLLPNEGAAPHNFTIDELDISVDLAPGAKESVVINAPAGTYEYYCNVPGHKESGMVGTLTVE